MRVLRLAGFVLALGALSGCATAIPKAQLVAELDEEMAYVCPMHADVTSENPGKCEKCGMALVLGTPFDMRDYRVDVATTPELPKAGEPVTLTMRVFHPGSDEVVTDFELVHEMPFHLFIVSQDLEYFQHLHPTAASPGVWTLSVVLPKPGSYRVISDFAPRGSSSQMSMRPLITADTDEGDLDAHPNLQLPERNVSVVDDLEATVSFDPPQLAAGRHGHVIFTVRDATNRQPIRELQPYLGAFGHLFITDEKMVDYVHSHPVDTPSENLDPSQVHGGPTVMFEGLMPKPGRYRAWAQFKYRDKLYTFQTTFDVVEPGT